MTLGGVIHRAVILGCTGLALGAAAALPAAAEEAGAAGAPGPRFFAPGARLGDPLPTFQDPPASPERRLAAPPPRTLLPSLAHRAGDGLPLAARRPDGLPLYGMLAGRALLSALDAGDVLPEAATPWFDGDVDRMVAGFEFSF